MKNVFDKNDLIFYYQQTEFPKNKIAKDVLMHKEYIFNDNSEEPQLTQTTKKTKYGSCFIVEEEIEPRGGGKMIKKGIQGGKFNQQFNKMPHKPKENVWRKNEPEENSGGFFDDFKGKTDEKQVEKFKRNLDNSVSKENSISIEKCVFADHLLNAEKKDKFSEEVNQSLSADNFFEIADQIMGTKENISTKDYKLSEKVNNIYDPNPKIVQIDLIFKVNQHLKYPEEENLWYILHPAAKTSYGPLSSKNIKEMYTSKMLDGQSEFRFIDVYNYQNKRPFSFFPIKEIEKQTFLEDIDISPILKVAVAIKAKKLKEDAKPNLNVEETKKEENKLSTVKSTDQNTSKNNLTTSTSKNTNNISPDDLFNKVPTKTTTQIPKEQKKIEVTKDDNKIEDNFFDSSTQSENTIKKFKKVPKGKPNDLNVQLGFKIGDEESPKKKTPIIPIKSQNTNNSVKNNSIPFITNSNSIYDQKDSIYNNEHQYDDEYDNSYNYNNNYGGYNNNYYNNNNSNNGNYYENKNNNNKGKNKY